MTAAASTSEALSTNTSLTSATWTAEPAPRPRAQKADRGPRARANPCRGGPRGASRSAPSSALVRGPEGETPNLGLWARSDAGFAWLSSELTEERFRELLPESRDLVVDRYELANLRALNFVVHGLLGEGVASSTRPDPQAKSLGEYLRSRVVDLPIALLGDSPNVVAGAPAGDATIDDHPDTDRS